MCSNRVGGSGDLLLIGKAHGMARVGEGSETGDAEVENQYQECF